MTKGRNSQSRKLLKMKELSAATGVTGGTIRYYIQQGILPRPVKTHKNMAYYDESYIDRILLIKKLQKSRFLPLDVIKNIIADMDFTGGEDVRTLLREIDNPLTNAAIVNGLPATMTLAELTAHSGLTKADMDAMRKLELITPDPDGRYNQDCIRLAEIVAEMRRIGLTRNLDFQVHHLRVHMDLIEFLVRKEVDLFGKRIAGKGLDRETASNLAKDAIEVINKLLPIIHKRMIRKIFEEAE